VRQILTTGSPFTAPDGTQVAELLTASQHGQISGTLSIALGQLAPGTCSAVHYHPVVTQFTYTLGGTLTAWMREPGEVDHYRLVVEPDKLIITQPNTLLQLCNEGSTPVTLLYVVTPPYLSALTDSGEPLFDDAIIAGTSWDNIDPPIDGEALQRFNEHRTQLQQTQSHS
tara:strand:+ start:2023 stop:2532 length:510 start_codon:yes stop_codon:yes gene_type:complete